MRKYKFGFTMSEVLIVIAIISVILALSVNSIATVQNSYTSLAYFAYSNVKDLVTEAIAGKIPLDNGAETTIYCHSDNSGIINILTPDTNVPGNYLPECYSALEDTRTTNASPNDVNYNSSDKDYLHFCNAIVEKANTKGVINCDSLFEATSDNTSISGGLSTATPTFTATNGQRYYLTARKVDSNVSDEFGFRIMAVDLNGTKGPNSTENTRNKPADIVTFIILDNGTVLPTGNIADNTQMGAYTVHYLTAKIKGKLQGTMEAGCVNDNCVSRYEYVPGLSGEGTMPFREAYCRINVGYNHIPVEGYCDGYTQVAACPSGSAVTYDACSVELIKPVFRYNL